MEKFQILTMIHCSDIYKTKHLNTIEYKLYYMNWTGLKSYIIRNAEIQDSLDS
ncbi:hypothetical protein AGMMS49960_21940 [Betaproteobacteria bacterium]|nr:hypothetical protein AGMMS49960_21940 [Betaproteobacteria bacterium]